MSDIQCNIVAYHQNPARIELLALLLDPASQDGDWTVESATVLDHAIIALVSGAPSMDTGIFSEELLSVDPDWLLVQTENTQTGETETICRKKGNKNTTKKNLLSNLRKNSKQVDLYFALLNQEISYLKDLLKDDEIGVDLNIEGMPLLFHIMLTADLSLFKQVVRRGADIHLQVERTQWIHLETRSDVLIFEAVKGMGLLSMAIEMKAKPIVKFLIESGIDVDVTDEKGNAPITIAAGDADKHAFIEPLVKAGADINHEGFSGWTPLFSLLGSYEYSAKKTISIAEKWMALGADIKHVCQNGANALWVAMGREQPVVDFVMSHGVREYQVPQGYYDGMDTMEILHETMNTNDHKTFSEYFDLANLDKKQQTELLHVAANNGRLRILERMIEAGMPPYLKRGGVFAFQSAKDMGFKEVANYLKDQMDDFYKEGQSRIEKARPLFDQFTAVFEQIDAQGGAEKDLSTLKPFAAHPFMKKYEPFQLAHWAKMAVASNKRVKVKAEVDDDFNVTFSRSNRFSGHFSVMISTDGEPQIKAFK